MVKGRHEASVAALSLIGGSSIAPVLYVIAAYLIPRGFADLRHASLQTVLYYFAVAWIVSLLLTALIGAPTWRPLHRRGWDGFLSYALIGAITAIIASVAFAQTVQDWDAVVMAAGNGLAIRAIERALR